MLAMIIPGGIIIASIHLLINIDSIKDCLNTLIGFNIHNPNDISIVYGIFLFVLIYLSGLTNSIISDYIFRGFRNNHTAIDYERLKILHNTSYINLNINSNIQPLNFTPVRFIKRLIIMCKDIKEGWSRSYSKPNHNMYYFYYYALNQEKLLGSVPLIEIQVALLRNTILPLIFLSLIVLFHNISWNSLLLSIEISCITIGMFILMVERQNKIYNMIWEASCYYKLACINSNTLIG